MLESQTEKRKSTENLIEIYEILYYIREFENFQNENKLMFI